MFGRITPDDVELVIEMNKNEASRRLFSKVGRRIVELYEQLRPLLTDDYSLRYRVAAAVNAEILEGALC